TGGPTPRPAPRPVPSGRDGAAQLTEGTEGTFTATPKKLHCCVLAQLTTALRCHHTRPISPRTTPRTPSVSASSCTSRPAMTPSTTRPTRTTIARTLTWPTLSASITGGDPTGHRHPADDRPGRSAERPGRPGRQYVGRIRCPVVESPV